MTLHLPKGDLKRIDELAETLIWIGGLSKEKKKIIDSKLKLIGSDLDRSLAELLEGPENFLQSEIHLPNREDPESIKSFLYAMQSQGRKARDTLNIAPGKISSLFNQHHIAGLREMFPLYAGKTAEQALDQSNRIYEETGLRPGSNKTNLGEIAGDRQVHLDLAHGGSYKGVQLAGTSDEMLETARGAIKLNQSRLIAAQEATKPLSNFVNEQITSGGVILKNDPYYDINLTSETAKTYRAAANKGMKLNFGRILTPTEVLEYSGMAKRLSGKLIKPLGPLLDAGGVLASSQTLADSNSNNMKKTAAVIDGTGSLLGLGSLANPALAAPSIGAGLFAAGDSTAPQIADAVAPFVPTPTLYSSKDSTGDVGRDAQIALENAGRDLSNAMDSGLDFVADKVQKGLNFVGGGVKFVFGY
tara:strand:- start:52 stop:1299 length:1248 start_codon:yes stop_codon:yes gene_type:complete